MVNIGLEGQMILGTWGAAYFTYFYGPWAGRARRGGAWVRSAALLHALATVTFGVDHIVSGVAINIIALGRRRSSSPRPTSPISRAAARRQLDRSRRHCPTITMPGLSDGPTSVDDKHWFVVSDLASRASPPLTTDLSLLTIIVAVLIVALTAWLLWQTSFGLRLRSCGESPGAAESLGVNVYRYKYHRRAGLRARSPAWAAAFLALVAASGFVPNGRPAAAATSAWRR